ncbi:MAG: response regulator transcription factor [Bdellovibrionales bacterium]|nr:response regulator transcription factor [Bdellovibrionales bacterium]
MEIKPKLLVLEDEKNVAATLTERLIREGFEIHLAPLVKTAEDLLGQHRFDLALLDVGLPDGDGFSFAKTLRARTPSCAIVFLTAFGNPEDRIKGLELGAEDYVVKPFHFKELVLRIRNALKRAEKIGSQATVRIGRAEVDFQKFQALVDGVSHPLTHKECMVLKLLVQKKGQVVSRDDILNEAWSEGEDPSPRTVDNFIVKIRRLVEVAPDDPKTIRSVRGVGYQLMDGEE